MWWLWEETFSKPKTGAKTEVFSEMITDMSEIEMYFSSYDGYYFIIHKIDDGYSCGSIKYFCSRPPLRCDGCGKKLSKEIIIALQLRSFLQGVPIW